jgi:hypothetical protein
MKTTFRCNHCGQEKSIADRGIKVAYVDLREGGQRLETFHFCLDDLFCIAAARDFNGFFPEGDHGQEQGCRLSEWE